MAIDIELLRSNFALVIEREPRLTSRFYELLFAGYPHFRRLFDTTRLEQQKTMLGEALVAVLDHLDSAPWLTTQLGNLGARHVGYGVTEDMYDAVGECLVRALAEASGNMWSPGHERAWVEAYGAIRDLMLAGAARVVSGADELEQVG